MGWTSCHRSKGQSDLAFFKQEFPSTGEGMIAAASVRRSVCYIVYETEAEKEPRLVPDENGKVRLALVILMKWAPRDPSYNFTYKEMDEFCGPCESECPERIFNMLSPLKPEVLAEANEEKRCYAIAWRERCRENLAKRQNAIKLRDGMYVTLPEPVEFRDGSKVGTFKVRIDKGWRKGSRKVRFESVYGYGTYLLPQDYRRKLVEVAAFDLDAYRQRIAAERANEVWDMEREEREAAVARAWEAERPDMYEASASA